MRRPEEGDMRSLCETARPIGRAPLIGNADLSKVRLNGKLFNGGQFADPADSAITVFNGDR